MAIPIPLRRTRWAVRPSILAVQPDVAVCRPLQPDDDLQERALAGPVRTDDGDDVAVVDPERDAVDGRETPERFVTPSTSRSSSTSGYDGDDTGSAAAT